MLAKEKEKLAALRDIKSKLLLEATSGAGGEVSDEVAIKIVMKLHKQRMETYNLYKEQNRDKTKEYIKEKIICACCCSISRCSMPKHKKSQNHKALMNAISTENNN
jgi:uncharacterized protein YqeY